MTCKTHCKADIWRGKGGETERDRERERASKHLFTNFNEPSVAADAFRHYLPRIVAVSPLVRHHNAHRHEKLRF